MRAAPRGSFGTEILYVALISAETGKIEGDKSVIALRSNPFKRSTNGLAQDRCNRGET